MLGSKSRTTPARASATAGSARTLFSRFWPRPGLAKEVRMGHALGYASHLGLALVVFGGVYHIEVFEALLGVSWPALPAAFVNAAACRCSRSR